MTANVQASAMRLGIDGAEQAPGVRGERRFKCLRQALGFRSALPNNRGVGSYALSEPPGWRTQFLSGKLNKDPTFAAERCSR